MGLVRTGRLAAVAAACVLTLTGCSSGDSGTPSAAPTPIAELDTASMTIPRTPFCAKVPANAIADALGTHRSRLAAYDAGDRTAVAGATDSVDEDGCAWVAIQGDALARAWVFASRAGRSLARMAIKDARTSPGCRLTGAVGFGSPSLTQVCRAAGSVRVRHAGLFGHSWLTCELSDAAKLSSVRARADAWCVQVANALDTAR